MSGHFGFQKHSTPRATVTPTVRDLEWAAGFLEGEGSFSPSARSHRVAASQNTREPLERLQRLFGGSICANTTTNNVLVWQTYGSRARGVAFTLYPLLSMRRQAQINRFARIALT